ncbi:hypothetical protein PTSG_04070 [Salpingoeca rosetta]|uniref:SWIM-type domain-containing protein n=1 Tax=Salpingoeca rosetta (strain ATCC 50818 / BSB-021) TaxID=946362 RepID=F2U7P5_SALR5|nr:uncharacterized protein PTSG_04070 [Salpingoeca rosetta]EGD83462.1 hypothetical protein PTSG_04070 [Salpingoeca rosetta]|eukprot:XP_004994966.1 hypothetical protein PTSG_04070 [Salpingoeca rosetta]
MKPFECPASGCSVRFTRFGSGKRHICTSHKGADVADLLQTFKKNSKEVAIVYPCPENTCTQTFSSRQALSRHQLRDHGKQKARGHFQCRSGCADAAFCTAKELMQHVITDHDASCCVVRYYASWSRFESCIAAAECDDFALADYVKRDHTCCFPPKAAAWGLEHVQVEEEFVRTCSRHGNERPYQGTIRAHRAKAPKPVGCCPAMMWGQVCKGGRVRVVMFNYHSHSKDLLCVLCVCVCVCSLPCVCLCVSARSYRLCRACVTSIFKQAHVYNVAQEYEPGRFDADDAASVWYAAQIYNKEAGEHTPVITALKLQGQEAFEFGGPEQRASGDFPQESLFILVQTEWQRRVLKRGGRKRLWMGIPVAHAIVSHETIGVVAHFLRKAVADHGITPSAVITDKTFAEGRAVDEALPNSRWLLCQFHVKQAWLRHFSSRSKDGLSPVKDLEELMKCSTIQDFERGKRLFSERYKDDPKVLDYSRKHYFEWAHLWADYCRRPQDPTTNNYIESFHRVLKEHLDRKSGRADYLLRRLLSFAEEQRQKVLHAQVNGVVTKAQRCASSALSIAKQAGPSVDRTSDLSFTVSFPDKDPKAVTMRAAFTCEFCSRADCIHVYECVCPAYKGSPPVCKHTAAVFIHTTGSTDPATSFPVAAPTPEHKPSRHTGRTKDRVKQLMRTMSRQLDEITEYPSGIGR